MASNNVKIGVISMGNNNFANMAMNMLKSNPNINRNPMAKELMDILQSGDTKRGEAMANNILNNYGLNRDDAVNQAKSFFHIQ